jgi:hypothetical protein
MSLVSHILPDEILFHHHASMVHLLQRDLDPARPRYLSRSSHGWFNPGLSWLDWFKRVGNRQTMDMETFVFCFHQHF